MKPGRIKRLGRSILHSPSSMLNRHHSRRRFGRWTARLRPYPSRRDTWRRFGRRDKAGSIAFGIWSPGQEPRIIAGLFYCLMRPDRKSIPSFPPGHDATSATKFQRCY
jgi:hypothetical protein